MLTCRDSGPRRQLGNRTSAWPHVCFRVLSHKNLCACIAELRQREDKAGPPAPEPRPHNRAAQADPLANVRRLTEDRRPGFNYTGTLPEKDLFGD